MKKIICDVTKIKVHKNHILTIHDQNAITLSCNNNSLFKSLLTASLFNSDNFNEKCRNEGIVGALNSDGEGYWFQFDKDHKDSDKPAWLITYRGCKSLNSAIRYEYGQLNEDTIPSALITDMNIFAMFWYKKNKLARDNNLPIGIIDVMINIDEYDNKYTNDNIWRCTYYLYNTDDYVSHDPQYVYSKFKSSIE